MPNDGKNTADKIAGSFWMIENAINEKDNDNPENGFEHLDEIVENSY